MDSQGFYNIASPISGGLGALAGIGSAVFNYASTNRTNRNVRELAEQQNKWNLEQWNRQNNYDSPSAQMQRFAAAGLNPNLIYGEMSNGSPSAPMVSGFESQRPPQLDGIDTAFNQISQAQNLELQRQQIEANNSHLDKQNELILKELNVKDEEINNLRELNKQIQANTQYLNLLGMGLSYSNRITMFDSWIKHDTYRMAVRQFAADTKIKESEAANVDRLMALRILGLDRQASKLLSDIGLNNRLAQQAYEIGQYYNTLAFGASKQNELLYNTYLPERSYLGFSDGKSKFTGQKTSYAEFEMLQGFLNNTNQVDLQGKAAELIHKFGDSKEVLGLLLMGSQILEHTSNSISNFLPWKSTTQTTDSKGNYYETFRRNFLRP